MQIAKPSLKTYNRNVPIDDLLRNLESVWVYLGRQPVFRDMVSPISKYSAHTYVARFGSWINALQILVQSINIDASPYEPIHKIAPHVTSRNPGNKLKIQILMRDGNTCNMCGTVVSPDNIHFDHIIPWAKGGETTLDNLQVLCSGCNWSKGDKEAAQ